MNIQIDREYLLNTFRRVVETPSPVGYYTSSIPFWRRWPPSWDLR